MNRLRNGTLPALQLRDILRSPLDALPDAELLDRFARYADHDAFESLVRRHGAMVFGVCRRMLTDYADAEDAFQATFLVFIRKAHSLRRADRLGPWLYGVACRVAMKARARAARLAKYRAEATEMIPDTSTPDEVPDWLPILDAELAALPAKYRDALILCELQGVSRADAAKSLGLREGTLSSRLARGREMLRRRLLKHGTLLPASGIAGLLSAGSIGGATVPAVLLKKTFGLANIGTGAAAAGAVPVGAAQLTDAVLKTMFFTKLKLASGACFALLAVAVGLASVPSDVPGQAKADSPSAKATALPQPAAKPVPAKLAATGPAKTDRETLQGLWILDKVALGKDIRGVIQEVINQDVGKMRFLVADDVWWILAPDSIQRSDAKIDPSKNPKWLDLHHMGDTDDPTRMIYELKGDRLRVAAVGDGKSKTRPAEFTPEDEVYVMEFRREQLPPPAGDKVLVNSWRGPFIDLSQVEIMDGYVFIYSGRGKGGSWIGGRYTVDTTKNPMWIDVELITPSFDDRTLEGGAQARVTKVYGCYEVTDTRLRFALGTTGKRVTRPLEFKDGPDVLFFDSDVNAKRFGPLLNPEVAPAPKDVTPLADEQLKKLLKAQNHVAAEERIRAQLPTWTGLRAIEAKLMLGSVLMAQGLNEQPATEGGKSKLKEAERLYRVVIKAAEADTTDSKRAGLLRTSAERMLLILLQHEPQALLFEAAAMLERHKGAIEELIVLSAVYQAYTQRGQIDKMTATRDRMKDVFKLLPANAFTADEGEYSRAYWEKELFAKEK